ncbi:MAG: DMT family transporter [Chloroflexota bacterium]
MNKKGWRLPGIGSALASALCLGFAPIFGKQAILSGFSPLATVALRTLMAALLLLLIVAIFRRPFLFIYPAGLIGCGLAGLLNGVGSLFYYVALGRLTVSMGQLIYSLYPVFLVIWMIVDRQPLNRLTYLRVAVALAGVAFLTLSKSVQVDWVGVALMVGASVMYALHIPINQRVLYDIPAPTVTLYTLLAMSVVVVPAYFLLDRQFPPSNVSWTPILALTIVTFLSRLTLFLGVKKLGGMQTALLGLSELFVSLLLSHLWLHERLSTAQWVGALLLILSLALIGVDKMRPEKKQMHRLLAWLRPPELSADITWSPRD